MRVAYDGSAFAGFQRQAGRPTVQAALETALGEALGEPIATVAASRTDAGVHARAQVVGFKWRRDMDAAWLAGELSRRLATRISVASVVPAVPSFHARWSATGKTYAYRFTEGALAEVAGARVTPVGHPELLHGATLPVEFGRVGAALAQMPGEGVYGGLCGRGPKKVRLLRRVELVRPREAGDVAVIWVEGPSFGRFMVRNLVGLAIATGMGFFQAEEVPAMIHAQRQLRGLRAPAQGLELWEVQYPAGVSPW